MGAPLGNQFWKLRSKHGRDTLFSTPEELLKACETYFNWVDAHPWYKTEQLKKPYQEEYIDGNQQKKMRWVTVAKIPTARPYTIQGLCRFLNCNTVWFNQFEKATEEKMKWIEEGKTDGLDVESVKGFSQILAHVRDVIYQQKFEGAAVNAFNWNVIARELQLKEQTDITSGGEKLKTQPPQIIIQSAGENCPPITEEINDESE